MYSSIVLKRYTRADLWLIFAALVMCFDGIANYFTKAPVFVAFTPVFIALILHGQNRKQLTRSLLIITSLIVPFLIKSIDGTFIKDDVSDISLLLLSVLSIIYFSENNVSNSTINTIFIIILIMFSLSFVGIDATLKNAEEADIFNSGSTDIEFYRSYRSGLFRLAHVASYLLFLIAIYSFSLRRGLNFFGFSIGWQINALVSIVLLIYTGSRTPIVALIVALPIYYASRSVKGVLIAIASTLGLVIVAINIDLILRFTNDTVMYQYFSFIKTTIDNPERLSRVIIWQSWYNAISEFGPWDLVFGKSLSSALEFNQKTLGLSIWFHNDFLGIFYTCGLVGLFIYLFSLAIVIKKAKSAKSEFYIFNIIFFMIFAAIANGLFKYYPFFFVATLNVNEFCRNRFHLRRNIIVKPEK